MQPEGSLPYSEVPDTCPYPEPTLSNPHTPLQFPGFKMLRLVKFETPTALWHLRGFTAHMSGSFTGWTSHTDSAAPSRSQWWLQ
jgi:hypothetical protein